MPGAYERYKTKCVATIEDAKENIMIVPEIWPLELDKYAFIQKAIWWLSVKNAPRKKNRVQALSVYKKVCRFCKKKYFDVDYFLFGKPKPYFSFTEEKSKNVVHLYQSRYCERFLEKNRAKNILPLAGFINRDFFTDTPEEKIREDIVLYNPRKGMHFTAKLLALCPALRWVPIRDMTPGQISDIMHRSKVYIDFGPFPGRDRLPREAAASRCCLIVGRRGAARYFQDVTIPDEYKFDTDHFMPLKVLEKIKECLKNYEVKAEDFDAYGRIAEYEEEQFEIQIKQIFGVRN